MPNQGHCTRFHLKRKRPDAKICEYFLPGPDELDAPVTKDYLTQKTLEHFLSLRLLSDLLDSATAVFEKENLK